MPYGVDAWVQAVKALEREAVVDRVLSEPQLHQLNARYHPVLPLCQLSNLLLASTSLS